MARADVTIRGAGIWGLAIGWACAARGARVRVIDPAGIGAGASGGVVGALCPHVPEGWDAAKALQLAALRAAPAFWAAVADAGGGDPGYARQGRLQPLRDAAAVARARDRAGAAAARWGPEFRWEVVPASGAPWEPLSPTGLLLFDTLSARLAPRAALAALAAALRARGGTIAPDGPEQGAVVEATGAAGLAAAGLGAGVKGQAALLTAGGRGQPQVGAPGLHVVPHADGTTAIGSTTEPDAQGSATDDRLEALVARARALVPALREAPVIARWAGLRPRASAAPFLLGPHPARPGAFLANGGYKIGFGLAPEVARLMADLVLEGRDAIPPEVSPPGRAPPPCADRP